MPHRRLASLGLRFLVPLVLVAGCAGTAPTSRSDAGPEGGVTVPSNSPTGPKFLSFGTNLNTVRDPRLKVVVSAVLTDPDGVDDIVGGALTDDTGATLGSFATSAAEGSYSLTLTWAELAQRPDVPSAPNVDVRPKLTAKFFDVAGHSAIATVTITLSCGDADSIARVVGNECEALASCTNEGGPRTCSFTASPMTGDKACGVNGKKCTSCGDSYGTVSCTATGHYPTITCVCE